MNKALLIGLGCALLIGGALYLWLTGSSSPAPKAGASPVPVQVPPAGGQAAASGEKVKLESSPVAANQTPPIKPQPAAAASNPPPAKPVPAAKPSGFLPYPNEGESDLKKKYDGLSLADLATAMADLQQRVNDEAQLLIDARFAKGLFTERSLPPSDKDNADAGPPQGVGEVRSFEKVVVQPDGKLKQQTTWLNQAEHPEFFAHQAEYLWVMNAHQQLLKQSGGH